jgi:Predicted metal-binding protein
MKKLFKALSFGMIAIAITAAAPSSTANSVKPTVVVYKDPNCGCCKKWVAYLANLGYKMDVKDTDKLAELNTTLHVPESLVGCHTALVGGYIIEGHVPAADIARLLSTKPKIAGLSVPGMPAGSPGMEGPPPTHYQVIAFTKTGATSVFAKH